MGTFSIASTLGTLWTGAGFDLNAIEEAARLARSRGETPYLHVVFQKLLNNGVEDPREPFKHDWRFTGGGEACFEITRQYAGVQNAIAQALIARACQGEGTVNFPCFYAVSTSPDGFDCD